VRPVDPRLLRYARSTRVFLMLTVVFGALTAAVVILQARLLSTILVDVTADGASADDVATLIGVLALAFAVRGLLASATEIAAFRSAARAKLELRETTLATILDQGPLGPAGQDPGAVTALVTRGIDGLDAYFARYLPQLVLAVIVPLAVLMTILGQDLLSTLIIAVTLPLIPVFMILIGLYTRGRVDRQWRTMTILSGHFLDLIAGLPTLKAFGRARAQARAIQAIGDEYRRTTMGVLRVSFLSSLVLELLATLSVALVAVSVGLRLAEGQLQYSVALFVLLLAPEAYLPLRLVGQHFHAAAEGLGAAQQMLTIIENSPSHAHPAVADRALGIGAIAEVCVVDLSVTFPGRSRAALAPTSFTARAGQLTVVVGHSGAGKSTLINTLMGFIPASGGFIRLADASGGDCLLSPELTQEWRARVGWVPQRAHLVGSELQEAVTIRQVVCLGRSDTPDEDIWTALHLAGMADEVSALSDGLNSTLARDGTGLSGGQRQRLALARALLGNPEVLILDEPTASLDGVSEQAVIDGVLSAARRGCVVIAVAHRPALAACADQLVRVGSTPLVRDVGEGSTPQHTSPALIGSPGW
jgi:ATP-binding cassette subfamily C protein CydCD